MAAFRFSLLALFVAATACAADANAQKGLLKENPFQSAGAPGATTAPQETIEFAGVSAVGKHTDLIIYDKTAKKSHWIAEGETKDGISVLRYDARRETVVVKLNGVEKTLTLRKGTRTAGSPAPVQPMPTGFNVPPPAAAPAVTPLPTAASMTAAAQPTSSAATPATPPTPPKPEVPQTPEAQAKAETEARMLVSDLLEIGMAQRRAYEEAQRKAADGTAQPNAQTPPQNPGQPGGAPAATQPTDKPNGE